MGRFNNINKENKFNYLVKTLSRTNRKDYENYVINRLYNCLNDFDIKPVTQQYVKLKSGGYALIDLYFPQLNIGIECDELHHLNQQDLDNLRFEDIVSALDDYREIRIPIYADDEKYRFLKIEEINNKIDKAVLEIKKIKDSIENFEAWDGKPDVEKAIKKGVIRVEDFYVFNQSEFRKFFGKSGYTQRAFYKLRDDYYIWCPGLAIENNGAYVKYNKNQKFINILSNDGEQIYEYIDDPESLKDENIKRVVFVKTKDKILNVQVYKFVGVFKRKNGIEYKNINGVNMAFAVCELIEREIHNK